MYAVDTPNTSPAAPYRQASHPPFASLPQLYRFGGRAAVVRPFRQSTPSLSLMHRVLQRMYHAHATQMSRTDIEPWLRRSRPGARESLPRRSSRLTAAIYYRADRATRTNRQYHDQGKYCTSSLSSRTDRGAVSINHLRRPRRSRSARCHARLSPSPSPTSPRPEAYPLLSIRRQSCGTIRANSSKRMPAVPPQYRLCEGRKPRTSPAPPHRASSPTSAEAQPHLQSPRTATQTRTLTGEALVALHPRLQPSTVNPRRPLSPRIHGCLPESYSRRPDLHRSPQNCTHGPRARRVRTSSQQRFRDDPPRCEVRTNRPNVAPGPRLHTHLRYPRQTSTNRHRHEPCPACGVLYEPAPIRRCRCRPVRRRLTSQ